MVELTTSNIVKAIIAVIVLIVVVAGVFLALSGNLSYFTGIGPSEQPDLTTPYYQNLLQDENLVASLRQDGSKFYISVKEGESFSQTNYYISERGNIVSDNALVDFFNDKVGETNSNGKIVIFNEYLILSPALEVINGGEKIENGIYKIQ